MDWFALAEKAGMYAAPLLMGALIWMNFERLRLLGVVEEKDKQLLVKDEKLANLSLQTSVTLAEIKTFLFNSGRPA